VLSTFKNQDAEEIARTARLAAEAVEYYICSGPEKTMNKFN
jgi:peptidyl-tRNA hydrolase